MNVGEWLAYGEARAAQAREQPETRRDRSRRFYSSRAWRALRFKALALNAERHGSPQCELCGRSRRDGAVLDVDHIVPLSRDWSLRLNQDNLQILCRDCNFGKSNRSTVDFRPATPVEPDTDAAAPATT